MSDITNKYSVGVLVVSDSCSNGTATDQSGLNLKQIVNNNANYLAEHYAVVPDNIETIKAKLIEWSDESKLNLVLTTGGSGFSPSDLTPEATKQVIDKETSSLTTTILVESLKITRFAALSRATSGIRKNTLIVNLPGSKKGSQEGLEIILPTLKHALDLINNRNTEVRTDHVTIQSGNAGTVTTTSTNSSDGPTVTVNLSSTQANPPLYSHDLHQHPPQPPPPYDQVQHPHHPHPHPHPHFHQHHHPQSPHQHHHHHPHLHQPQHPNHAHVHENNLRLHQQNLLRHQQQLHATNALQSSPGQPPLDHNQLHQHHHQSHHQTNHHTHHNSTTSSKID